jgi:hypothetical protein
MVAGRTIPRALILWAALLVLSALPTAGMFGWLLIADPFGGLPHPTDKAMLAQFHAERRTLEELVRMAGEDRKLVRLGPDFTRPEDLGPHGISVDRITTYRRLCAKARIPHGFTHYGDAIGFIVHTRGLAISGSAKGFVYAASADPDAKVVEGDLDAAAASAEDKDVLLERKIDDNWWLALDMR